MQLGINFGFYFYLSRFSFLWKSVSNTQLIFIVLDLNYFDLVYFDCVVVEFVAKLNCFVLV